MNTSIFISFIVILIALVLIVYLFISLSKQGDELQKYIKDKSVIQTFYFTIFYLVIISIPKMLYVDFIKGGKFGLNPFVVLAMISVYFLLSLMINKKKYGV
jgi:predicted PurR-regulated permease PerM